MSKAAGGNLPAQLIRVIGRWSLTVLVVNGILGSGIFGLPAPLAAAVGGASPWVVLLAGSAMLT